MYRSVSDRNNSALGLYDVPLHVIVSVEISFLDHFINL